MTLRLFDSHSHIQMSQFDSDRDAAIERGRAVGLVGQLILGTDVPSSRCAIDLSGSHEDMFAAAGCHPHEAKDMDEASLEELAEMAADPLVLVVGEIGLDYYRNLSAHDVQAEILSRQLQTATEVAKPVAVHGREAHEGLLPILESWSKRCGGRLPDGRPLGVMHYFDADVALAERYVELGFLISIHCSVTYPKATKLQEVAAKMPLDVLLVETDSPYGPPQSHRGQRNEPAYVEQPVMKIAELRDDTVEHVADATTDNTLWFLGVNAASAAGRRPTTQGAAR